MNSTNFFYLILLSAILSCSSEGDFEKEIGEKLSEIDLKFDKKYKYIVILPGAGCQTCISSIEEYFRNNIKDEKRTLLILTQFANKKLLTIAFSQTVLELPNVYLDDDNIFNKGMLQSLYPIIVYLDDHGSLIKSEYASPEHPKTLDNYITSM